MNRANKNVKKKKKITKMINKSWSPNQIFCTENDRFDQFQTLKNYFETPNFEIFAR